jgi:hypothetical protein
LTHQGIAPLFLFASQFHSHTGGRVDAQIPCRGDPSGWARRVALADYTRRGRANGRCSMSEIPASLGSHALQSAVDGTSLQRADGHGRAKLVCTRAAAASHSRSFAPAHSVTAWERGVGLRAGTGRAGRPVGVGAFTVLFDVARFSRYIADLHRRRVPPHAYRDQDHEQRTGHVSSGKHSPSDPSAALFPTPSARRENPRCRAAEPAGPRRPKRA